MRSTLRSLTFGLAATMAAALSAQLPYTLVIQGTISGCVPFQQVTVATLGGASPMYEYTLEVFPNSCFFDTIMEFNGPSVSISVSTQCNGTLLASYGSILFNNIGDTAVLVMNIDCNLGGTTDCNGVLNGPDLPGTACTVYNTNLPGLWNANCSCLLDTTLSDCEGVPGGTAMPGTPCTTLWMGQVLDGLYTNYCVCDTTALDCLGVPYGPNMPGTACTTLLGSAGTWNIECECIPNSSCQACFTVSSNQPWTVNLNNCTVLGTPPFEYFWNLSDGSVSSISSPEWTLTQAGNYSACLTIVDSEGCTSSACDSLSIDANGALIANPIVGDCLQIPNGPNLPGTPCTNPATGETGTWSADCECITNTTGCQAGFWVLQAYEGDSLSGEVTPIPYELWVWNLSSGTSPFQFLWNFGDGTTSTDPYPTHVYAQSGPYELCLTLTDAAGCTSTSCDSVSIDGNGLYDGMAPVEEAARNGFTIRVVNQLPMGIADQPAFTDTRLWPNPVNDVLNLRFDTSLRGNLQMSVIDVNGRVVLVANAMIADGTNQLNIATGALPSGIYMLRMGIGNETMSFRFVRH
jgi:hypothetical protein